MKLTNSEELKIVFGDEICEENWRIFDRLFVKMIIKIVDEEQYEIFDYEFIHRILIFLQKMYDTDNYNFFWRPIDEIKTMLKKIYQIQIN